MIDLHAHLLPGVDDGADSLEEAVEMCRLAAEDGCTAIAATPHQRTERWVNLDREDLARRLAELRAAVGPEPEILSGGEVRIDSRILDDLRTHPESGVLSLGESQYLLLELDRAGLGPEPEAILYEVRLLGWRPIVAHPELYRWLEPQRAVTLVEEGALLQVTAMSVLGELGRTAQKKCRELLDYGAVSIVASDCHGVDFRPPGLSLARQEVARGWGEEAATLLTETHPRAIVENRELEPPF